ncbi:MAG: glycosyl hydrolase family 32 [Chitinophagaceae bacterium]|nr:MAG: glycosyl hydrolase family 32 [Chitinophagaceae bacterium]
MYSGSGFSDWEIGDITVIIHNAVYHLFHLIIPNHDYIAHAISHDGISWKRVNNALFVGHPGEWDDDMLWTMHVVEKDEAFEMYYTGLQRRDRGIISRIGFAHSKDLINWTKDLKNIYPIQPKGIYYETHEQNPRKWLSFRDPFKFDHNGETFLLMAARSIHGPVSRRGCVGLVKITDDSMELMPPLLHPMVYDDVECPCVFKLNGRFYLLGSIREDIKVRYWSAPDFFGEYHSFHEDVLLPPGNYAARTVEDGPHLLVYNFFYAGQINTLRVLPPPKQLSTDDYGRLVLKSYYRWDQMITHTYLQEQFGACNPLLKNPTAFLDNTAGKITCGSRSGYELFCFQKPCNSFIWEGMLTVEGLGKLGLILDMDADGNGYFISLDITHGETTIRSWGFNPLNNKQNFIFSDIQTALFNMNSEATLHFKLISYGNYIEFSVNGVVKLTLMDYTFSGAGFGLYTASSVISLQHSLLHALPDPQEEYVSPEEAQPTVPKVL